MPTLIRRLLQRDINTARYQGSLDELQEHLNDQLISPGLVLGGVPGAQPQTGSQWLESMTSASMIDIVPQGIGLKDTSSETAPNHGGLGSAAT